VVAVERETTVLQAMTDYAERVLAGEIVAGRLVHLACERHLRDVDLGEHRGLWFDEDEAQIVVEFFAGLRHSKGRWGPQKNQPGQPFILEPWQIFVVCSIFGWKRADGTRRFRRAHIELARKNGKTTLAAGIGLYMLTMDDEPGAEVYSAATKRDQAKLCWTEARNMVRATPSLARRILISDSRSNMAYAAANAKFEPMGRDADTADGPNPHCGIIDELHAHPNRDMVDVLETGVGARQQPLILIITTAGYNQAGIWFEKRSYAIRVVEQVVEDDELFVFIATLDEDDDWRDESVWPKANPNLDVSVYRDTLRAACREAIESPEKQPALLTKQLNVPTNAARRWIDVITEWDPCDAEPEIKPGDGCFVGIDIASTIDMSAALALFPRDSGLYDVACRFWRPAESVEEAERRDRVPYRLWAQQGYLTLVDGTMMDPAEIAEDILDWTSRWQVHEFPFDRYNAASVGAKIEAAGGLPVPMSQGAVTYSEPCHLLKGLLVAKRLRHGGHPILRWMAGQVMVKAAANDALRPWKPEGSGIRDDGITALLMALARALVHQGVLAPPTEPRITILDLSS
jgi:phage terminase large subunit-like protein